MARRRQSRGKGKRGLGAMNRSAMETTHKSVNRGKKKR